MIESGKVRERTLFHTDKEYIKKYAKTGTKAAFCKSRLLPFHQNRYIKQTTESESAPASSVPPSHWSQFHQSGVFHKHFREFQDGCS